MLPLGARIVLSEYMSRDEMEKTGVDSLNYSQKMALQAWINDNFELLENVHPAQEKQLYIQMNIEEGAVIELSDGKSYEIDPDDRIYTVYWITPIPVRLSESGNASYPVRITNLNTGSFVRGREVSTRGLIKEAEEAEKAAPPSSDQDQSSPKPKAQPKQTQPKQEKPQPAPKKQPQTPPQSQKQNS